MADSETLPPEYLTVARHIADINSRIPLAEVSIIANELFQAALIRPASHGHATAIGTGTPPLILISSLMSEAMAKIKTCPSLFQNLIEILRKRDNTFATTLTIECLTLKLEGSSACVVDIADRNQQSSHKSQGLVNPITSYSSYLKEVYMSMSHCNITQHWTNLPQCEYIQLAMIEKRGLRYHRGLDEQIRLVQQGEVSTVMSNKQPVSLDELLYPPLVVMPPPVNRVLLFEGAPGGGKTTLSLYICHQWTQDAYWLSRFELVVLVYLRDPSVQSATTLADILPACSLDMSQRMASQMQAVNGQGVLFIFDGWDEFPQHLLNSVISTIIRQPSKYSLHKSTVAITSRPEATVNLFKSADLRVEILGFTKQQVRDYVKKALNDKEQIQKFVQYLDEHPTIEGYCYVPLHAAVMVHVFLAMNKVLPTTLHELFCALAICCIVREVETHEPGKIQTDVRSFDDLPDDLNKKLHNHCTLAYEGLMQNKVVFYQEDLHNANLPAKLPSLGLLQAVEGLTLTSKTISYNFLHLSIQELLAAYYISQQESIQQVSILTRLLESSRFQPVLEFYSGITGLSNQNVQDFLDVYQNKQTCFVNILPLLHCLFEAQRPSSCWLISPKFRDLKLISIYFSPKDWLAIGYYISSLLSTVTSTANNICVHLYIEKSSELALLRELAKYTVTAGPMSPRLEIALNSSLSSHEGARLIASYLEKSPPLSKLWLYNNDKGIQTKTLDTINPDDFKQFYGEEAQQFHEKKEQQLREQQQQLREQQQQLREQQQHYGEQLQLSALYKQYMYLHDQLECYDKANDEQEFFSFIIFQLGINNRAIFYNAFCSQPRYLIEEAHKFFLLEMKLVIEDSNDGLLQITRALQSNTSLTLLRLMNLQLVYTEHNGLALTEMLQMNQSLELLDMSGNPRLSNSAARCIFLGLQSNTTLVELQLNRTGITEKGAEYIAQSLKINNSLQTLGISDNDIGDKGFAHIVASLGINTTLTSLGISYNGITDIKLKAQEINIRRQQYSQPTIEIF